MYGIIKKLFILLLAALIIGAILINYIIEESISKPADYYPNKEYAIVLGASVHGNELSAALKARMIVAIKMYKNGFVRNILLSGDGTDEYYSETVAMKHFALKNGVPQESILTDEKGYNTFATMIRARDVFSAKSAYIISQNFHLARAVWVAKECGIDAQGVSAGRLKDPWFYYLREFFARIKDYVQIKLKISFY